MAFRDCIQGPHTAQNITAPGQGACNASWTMFRFFPTNYPWDLSVNLSIEMGAKMGEIQEMCGPLAEAAKAKDAEGTAAFRQTWVTMADKLLGLADDDLALGRKFSAGDKKIRAANYMMTAERLLAHGSDGRVALYERLQDTFYDGLALSGSDAEKVEIPYGDSFLTGIFQPAEGVTGPQPVLVQLNGLDSTKEMKFLVGLPRWLAKRGIASLVVDQPGTGDALRLRNLTARYDAEHWATPIVDYLETRADVDPKRIGCEGVSLGGYYCPRAVAFRAALCRGRGLGREP